MSLRRTRLQRALSVLTDPVAGPPTQQHATQVVGMLGILGSALLAGALPTNEVTASLQAVARAYGKPELRVIVLPTFVLIEDPTAQPAQTSVFEANQGVLRLDQVDALERLMRTSAQNRTDAAEVVDRITGILQSAPRFGFWPSLLGHVLLTVGFGLVLNPTASALPVYAVLGAIVGVMVLLVARVRTLALVLPVLAAFVATVAAGTLAADLTSQSVLSLVTPAIASLLPGLTLTIATVELTNGQIIAGASRLLYGVATLSLLAFGLYVGGIATGATITHSAGDDTLGVWAPWAGIVLVAIGYYLYSAAPRGSLLWVLFALAVAYSGQLLGHVLLGATLSGLIGALIAVPTIYLVSHLPRAPQPTVMLTCAYWMMVPGTLGLIGLTETVTGAAGGGGTLLQTLGGIFAIAIGMIIGTGISRDTGAVARMWHGARPRPSSDAAG